MPMYYKFYLEHLIFWWCIITVFLFSKDNVINLFIFKDHGKQTDTIYLSFKKKSVDIALVLLAFHT